MVLGELAGDICLWTGVSHDPDRGDDIEFNGIVFYFFCAWELNGIAVCVCVFSSFLLLVIKILLLVGEISS